MSRDHQRMSLSYGPQSANEQRWKTTNPGWPDPNGKFWEVDIVFNRVRDLVITVCDRARDSRGHPQ